jgi:hypothetical protein
MASLTPLGNRIYSMAWNLRFPHAQLVTNTATIEVAMESPLRCSVNNRRSDHSHGELSSLVSLEIVPSEEDLPLNIDLTRCSDAYVRESDLIALYAQEYPWPFGYQIDVRYRPDRSLGIYAMELWLSVSTSMLACKPKLHIVPQNRFQPCPKNEIAVASHNRAALIIHPLDLADCESVAADSSRGIAQWDVFGGFMEKGVIRRSRFLIVWSDTEEPVAKWERALDSFAQSPLPLTA